MTSKWSVMALLGALTASATAAELPSIFGESPAPLQKWALMRGVEEGATEGFEEGATEGAGAAAGEEGATEGAGAAAGKEGGKSPGKALLLSVLAPGAGQYYMGSKMRAAAFFGVEALLWGLYLSWKGEGNDIEEEFRAVADEHWNPQDYLAWRVLPSSRSSITHALPCSSFVASADPARFIGEVTEAIQDCRETEKQQYYELIGKYYQFGAGWSDLKDLSGNRAVPAQIDSVENYVSERRLDYEKRRDDSNKLLKRASNVAGVIMINHLFSAIDAARMGRQRSRGVDPARLERRTRFVFSMHRGVRGRVPMVTAYKPFY